MRSVVEVEIRGVTKVRSGKVREVFLLGDRLLMVATDRVSAFDVVLPSGIPDKGKVLNQLSAYWFRELAGIVENHMVTIDDERIASEVGDGYDAARLGGRSMIVEKCDPLLIECVARRFIAGSLYKEYLSADQSSPISIHGNPFPPGLRLCDELPETIFTPATKADSGHDMNISFDEATEIVGEVDANFVREKTLAVFDAAARTCAAAGIILADTKFEFGRTAGGIKLIDEVLTPDSSRFWPAESYEPGKNQPSLDKQFVRDYLETLSWDKTYPGPELPDAVALETRARYIDIFCRITGREPEL